MLRSTRRQINSPTSQTNSAIRYQVVLSSNCSASRWPARDAVRRIAQRTAGVVAGRGDDLQHDAGQRQRHQHEIMPGDAEAETGIGHHERQHARRQHAHGNADPWRHAEMVPQQRRHIGADAHEAAMPERHQAEAAHDRPRGIGERPDQDQHQDVQMIGIAIDKGQRDQRRDRDRPGSVARFDSLSASPTARRAG